jgi:formylglycine-generating enzyme required for sulfatase activity
MRPTIRSSRRSSRQSSRSASRAARAAKLVLTAAGLGSAAWIAISLPTDGAARAQAPAAKAQAAKPQAGTPAAGATKPGAPPPPAAAPAAAGKLEGYSETVPGTSVKFEMVAIPGGKFQMGSPPKEKGRKKDEGPVHEVEVRPFWMSKHEVTWDEYAVFLDIGVKNTLSGGGDESPDALTYPTPPYADETFGYGKGKQPNIAVTWHAANEYARWLSKKTGKLYRLPTEAEWEYACRAGSQTAYAFGDAPAKLGAHAVFVANAKKRPNLVGTKPANAFGLFDMHGNVSEWVLDRYEPEFYAKAKPGEFPINVPDDRRYPHVVRGGSWKEKAPALRCAARRFSEKWWSKQDPQNPQSIWWHTEATEVGFRLVRPIEEYPALKGFKSKMTPDSSY